MIITRTPVRLSIGGGGTDLPFYSSKYGCSLVTSTINHYIYVTVKKRFENTHRISYSKTEIVDSVDKIEHPTVREALRMLNLADEGLEITTIADVPSGCGLGTSSAFLVGLLNALHVYKREYVSSKKLAEEACEIEMNRLKEPCGKQDQYAAAFGGFISMTINKNGSVAVSPLNISQETIEALEHNLLMFYTGSDRSATEVLADQRKKAESEHEIYDYYHQISKIGDEISKALEKGEHRRFGEWMNIHWQIKQGISGKIATAHIKGIYDLAIQNGAVGGKLVGAGGSGFFVFYCDNNKQAALRSALADAGLRYFPFKFEFDGSKVIFNSR